MQIYEINGLDLALDRHSYDSVMAALNSMPESKELSSYIKTDKNGLIIEFNPPNQGQLTWHFIFYIQNLMIMQRLHLMDEMARKAGVIK